MTANESAQFNVPVNITHVHGLEDKMVQYFDANTNLWVCLFTTMDGAVVDRSQSECLKQAIMRLMPLKGSRKTRGRPVTGRRPFQCWVTPEVVQALKEMARFSGLDQGEYISYLILRTFCVYKERELQELRGTDVMHEAIKGYLDEVDKANPLPEHILKAREKRAQKEAEQRRIAHFKSTPEYQEHERQQNEKFEAVLKAGYEKLGIKTRSAEEWEEHFRKQVKEVEDRKFEEAVTPVLIEEEEEELLIEEDEDDTEKWIQA